MKNPATYLILFILALPAKAISSEVAKFGSEKTIVTTQTGPYIGMVKGRYNSFELGSEFLHKKKWSNRLVINAVALGFGYNYREQELSYCFSYWRKVKHFGMTYGFDLLGQSDFILISGGLSPTIGIRMWNFHIQSGYQFWVIDQTDNPLSLNTFFLRTRFTIVENKTRVKK
jgi:hypothetical protein